MNRYLPIALACVLLSGNALADDSAKKNDDEAAPNVLQARAAFLAGNEHAKQMRWGDALERYEASASLNPHAGTSYNIGICQRALGRYTLARKTFRSALAQQRTGNKLAPTLLTNIRAYLKEIDKLLARLDVTLAPMKARVSVDGRPLEHVKGSSSKMIAGTRPPGPPGSPARKAFSVVLDPGLHVFVVSRKGYSDVVVKRTVEPSSRGKLDLSLTRLPAKLTIGSTEDRAAVAIDNTDIGTAPLSIRRPPGKYRLLVRKDGFDPYAVNVILRPGEEVDILADLHPEAIGLHQRWWFWPSVGVLVATTVAVTFAVTRPDPERPPVSGGGLGWTIRVP